MSCVKVLKKAAEKLYQFFTPSYENLPRVAGFIGAMIMTPIATIVVPLFMFQKQCNANYNEDDNCSANNTGLTTTITSAVVVALISSAQQAVAAMLTLSTMQAMRKHYIKLLLDKYHFLLDGDTQQFSSMQYVTIGLGVKDFTSNAVPVFTALPMYSISSISTLVYIGTLTKSWFPPLVTLCFVSGFAIPITVFNKAIAEYQTSNQQIENKMVAAILRLEALKNIVPLMGASDIEAQTFIGQINKIDSTVYKISLYSLANWVFLTLSRDMSSKFIGTYYTNSTIQEFSEYNTTVLNFWIMSLMLNMINILKILTYNYAFIKLNLQELTAFDKAHNECVTNNKNYNKMQQHFAGNSFSLERFTIQKPDPHEPAKLITVLNNAKLELQVNKVYKLSANYNIRETFLKAITGYWTYTDGIVKFPETAKGHICFIPQETYIRPGTLLTILTYLSGIERITEASIAAHECKVAINEHMTRMQRINTHQNDTTQKEQIIHILTALQLIPYAIKEYELEVNNINWNTRLSRGEKQKIGIARALLTKPQFIVMYEAISDLEPSDKIIACQTIKDYAAQYLTPYIIIYTEHNEIPHFADSIITISGQNLEYQNIAH